MFNAIKINEVVEGICVVVRDRQLLYAGPNCDVSPPDDSTVYMNPADWDKLAGLVKQGRH